MNPRVFVGQVNFGAARSVAKSHFVVATIGRFSALITLDEPDTAFDRSHCTFVVIKIVPVDGTGQAVVDAYMNVKPLVPPSASFKVLADEISEVINPSTMSIAFAPSLERPYYGCVGSAEA